MKTNILSVSKKFLGYGFLFLAVVVGSYVASTKDFAFGSVSQGSEYKSNLFSTGRSTPTTILDTDGGTLGSVVITGAATGVINIYDATTTDIGARAPSQSTSTIFITSFPASTAAGTYTFDATFYRGLIVDIIGTIPTTTVTYR